MEKYCCNFESLCGSLTREGGLSESLGLGTTA